MWGSLIDSNANVIIKQILLKSLLIFEYKPVTGDWVGALEKGEPRFIRHQVQLVPGLADGVDMWTLRQDQHIRNCAKPALAVQLTMLVPGSDRM